MRIATDIKSLPPFASLPYERPDEAFLDDLFGRTEHAIKGAQSAAALREALESFETAWLHVLSMRRLTTIRAVKGPYVAFYRSEREWYGRMLIPNLLRLTAMVGGLDRHRFRRDLEPELGRSVFLEASRLSATIAPTIEDELLREAELIERLSEYSVQGGAFYSPYARHFAWDDAEATFDDERRRSDYLQNAAAFTETLKNRESLMASLIAVRTRMAERMGYRNYVEYALVRQGRDRDALSGRATFRNLVKKYIVPLCHQIRRLQADRLTKNELAPFDFYRLMPEVWPEKEQGQTQIEIGYGTALEKMIGGLSGYFSTLSLQGYINYDQADAKALSAPCFFLPDSGAAYLNAGDERLSTFVPSLFYATGVALTETISFKQNRHDLMNRPSLLVRSLAGAGLMVASYRHWDRLLGRLSGLALELELTRRLLEVPLMCAIEAFEEQLYQNPDWDGAKRSQTWRRLKRIFLPDEAAADVTSVIPFGQDWLTLESLVNHPFQQTAPAMALVMVLATRPFTRKQHENQLEDQLLRLLQDQETGSPLERMMRAGFLSPYETLTFRMAAFAAALALGL